MILIWSVAVALLAVGICVIVAIVKDKKKSDDSDEPLYINPSPVGGLPIGTTTPYRTAGSVPYMRPVPVYVPAPVNNSMSSDLITGFVLGEMIADSGNHHSDDSTSSASSFAGFGGGESGGGGASGSWDSTPSSSDTSSSYDSSSSSSYDSSSSSSDSGGGSSDW